MNTAENARLSAVPTATVNPIACSTGTLENASSPKPITVETFAQRSETSVRSRSSSLTGTRSKNNE